MAPWLAILRVSRTHYPPQRDRGSAGFGRGGGSLGQAAHRDGGDEADVDDSDEDDDDDDGAHTPPPPPSSDGRQTDMPRPLFSSGIINPSFLHHELLPTRLCSARFTNADQAQQIGAIQTAMAKANADGFNLHP